MLVIDRREDESRYAPGANRSEVQALLDRLEPKAGWESTAMPAPVEIEVKPEPKNAQQGVWAITETPGPEAVLRLLLKRVWNAELDG
mgnify:CR=1 FL=1